MPSSAAADAAEQEIAFGNDRKKNKYASTTSNILHPILGTAAYQSTYNPLQNVCSLSRSSHPPKDLTMNRHLAAAAILAALMLPHVFAQAPCNGTPLSGAVHDTTAALIPGARLTLDDKLSATSDSNGEFRFDCVVKGQHRLVITAPAFSSRIVSVAVPRAAALDLVLQPATVDTSIDISADDSTAAAKSPTASGPTQTITAKQLQSLADDPDDLLRELQQLSAAAVERTSR
jgi:hypothetical protein